MRVLIWEQHYRGAGHFVRACEIASRLQERHEVTLLVGGHEPGFARVPPGIRKIQLPIVVVRKNCPLDYIEREENIDFYAAEDGGDVRVALAGRRRIVEDTARQLRPHVFITELFPLRRSMYAEELLPATRLVREQGGRTLCSIREILQDDTAERTNPDKRPGERQDRIRYHRHTIAQLNAHFDGLLVHGDRRFISLEETHPDWMLDEIRIPVTYTGYVSEAPPPPNRCPEEIRQMAHNGGFVVTSVGAGGSGGNNAFSHGGSAIQSAVEAWKRLFAQGKTGRRRMVIFAGTHSTEEELQRIRQACGNGPFVVRRATPDFLCWLQAADLSISRAGYNTCTNILATRVPAILLPSHANLDQPARARIFAERGIASSLTEDELSPGTLAAEIERRLGLPPPAHDVDLDGAQATASLLETLVS